MLSYFITANRRLPVAIHCIYWSTCLFIFSDSARILAAENGSHVAPVDTSLSHSSPPSAGHDSFQNKIQPLLEQFCVRCHNVDEKTSGIRLDHLNGSMSSDQMFLWKDVLEQLSEESMPPEDEPQPSAEQRHQLIGWIGQEMAAAQSRTATKNGSVRRLTVSQYRNTLHSLLGIQEELTDVIPPDAVSEDGFVNNSSTMSLSPLLLEAYFDVAERALDLCIVDEDSLPKIQNFRMDMGTEINPAPLPRPVNFGSIQPIAAQPGFYGDATHSHKTV